MILPMDWAEDTSRVPQDWAPTKGRGSQVQVTGCYGGPLDCGSLANSIPPTGPMRRSSLAATAPFIAILADWRSSRLEYICQSPVEIGVRRNALRAIVGA